MKKTNLKDVREAAGYKQSEMAEKLGVSLDAYRKYEQGQRGLNGSTLVKLSQILGVTTDTILGTQYAEGSFLVSEEKELVSLYRSMDAEGRHMALETVRAYVLSGMYTED